MSPLKKLPKSLCCLVAIVALFIFTTSVNAAALPAKIIGLEVNANALPTDWSSASWHSIGSDIYIIYSGILKNIDGSAKVYNLDLNFVATDNFEIKLVNTTSYDPAVPTHIEANITVNSQKETKIPYTLTDGPEVKIRGNVYILPKVEIKIEVEVPSTPALTARTPSNDWPTPINLKFENTINPAPNLTASFPVVHFDPGNALVLIKNSLVSMPVTATANTGNDVKLKVVRDPADASAVGTGSFTLTPTNATNSAAIKTDKRGSFYIVGYVDRNNNNNIDANESSGVMPVIIVDVNLVSEDSKFRSKLISANTSDPGQFVSITSGEFDFSDFTKAGAHYVAYVDFIGGLDGKRGVDRVFAGWCNDLDSLDINGSYTNGRIVRSIFADNIPARTPSSAKYFLPADPAPSIVTGRLIDVTNHANSATGGGTICQHWTRHPIITNTANSPTGLGIRKKIEDIDSPGNSFLYSHPGFPSETLTSFQFDLYFRVFLICWTNTEVNFQSTGQAGERSYHALQMQPWTIDSDWTVALTPNTATPGSYNGVVTGNHPASNTGSTRTEYSPVKGADSVGCETRPPIALNLFAKDYQH